MKRRIITVLTLAAVLLALISGTLTAAAEIPYTSYTYWSNSGERRTEVYNRAMFSVETVLNAKDLKIRDFTALNDICTDEKGNIYLLDSA